jgi:hypothetical protein
VKRRERAGVWLAKANEAARQLKAERDPRRRELLENAAVVWARQAREARKLTQTQRRAIGTGVFCSTGSALFLVPPALAGWADVSGPMLVGGLGFPAAVATVFWLAKSLVDENDRRNVGNDRSARLGEVLVDRAEREHAAASGPVSSR